MNTQLITPAYLPIICETLRATLHALGQRDELDGIETITLTQAAERGDQIGGVVRAIVQRRETIGRRVAPGVRHVAEGVA